MKATGMEDNSEAKTLSRKSRGTLTVKWAGSRDKIFSPSGRGRTFFLTSLFIEPKDVSCGFSWRKIAFARNIKGAHFAVGCDCWNHHLPTRSAVMNQEKYIGMD